MLQDKTPLEFLNSPVVIAALVANGILLGASVVRNSGVVSRSSLCANAAGQKESSAGVSLVNRSLVFFFDCLLFCHPGLMVCIRNKIVMESGSVFARDVSGWWTGCVQDVGCGRATELSLLAQPEGTTPQSWVRTNAYTGEGGSCRESSVGSRARLREHLRGVAFDGLRPGRIGKDAEPGGAL